MHRSRFKTISGVSSLGQINILFSRRIALCLLFAILLIFSAGCRFFRTSIADTIELEQIIDESGITGGLIVYAGSGDIIFPSAWTEESEFLVHRLVYDQDRLLSVRESIRDEGLYGKVSAVEWDGSFLPYSDNMVNLLILSDESAGLSTRKFRKEIDRVLVPEGLAYVSRGGKFSRYKKKWPEDMDNWTHARYDASGNASSNDEQAGAPRHVQWHAYPRWNRSVKTSSMVSAGGRVFYILDDAHYSAAEGTWSLIARDAFNGILLWRREMPAWRGGTTPQKKIGPVQTDRLLVATEDRIYTVLSEFAPASILDAKTGEILQTLRHTESAEEIILTDNVLLVLANPNTPADVRRGLTENKIIFAHHAVTGEILWQHPVELIMPTTLAADHRQVVWHNGECIVNLDLRTGEQRWKSVSTGHRVDSTSPFYPEVNDDYQHYQRYPLGADDFYYIIVNPQYSPTLIIYEDYIAFAGGRQLSVFSSEDGSELWKRDYLLSNYSVPAEIFGFGGLLWGPDANMNLWSGRDMSLNFDSFDPYTGEIIDTIRTDAGFPFAHHRCHQMKTTAGQIIGGRAGIELIDTHTGSIQLHHWTRGSCHFGVMPGNGMLYVPPHDCACFVRSKLSGFYAFRAERIESSFKKEVSQRLYHGSDGFLSYDATNRLDWTYAPLYTSTEQGAIFDQRLNRYFYPSGRILVKDDTYVYGFVPGGERTLFSSPKDRTDIPAETGSRELREHAAKNTLEPVKFRWRSEISLWALGMLQADDILFIAGPPVRPGTRGLSKEAVEGSAESELISVSTSDGLTLSRKLLPGTPVWDGMAISETGLFISMRDGSVLCLKPKE